MIPACPRAPPELHSQPPRHKGGGGGEQGYDGDLVPRGIVGRGRGARGSAVRDGKGRDGARADVGRLSDRHAYRVSDLASRAKEMRGAIKVC